MSPEQKHAIIGRMTQEYNDAKRDAVVLRNEAESIGKTFLALGEILVNRPEHHHVCDTENPIFQRVDQLTESLRERESCIRKLRSQLHDAGVDVT